jgi:hypothetical protein
MTAAQQPSCPPAGFDDDGWGHPGLEPSLFLTSMAVLVWWGVSVLLGPIALAFRRARPARSKCWWLEEDGL